MRWLAVTVASSGGGPFGAAKGFFVFFVDRHGLPAIVRTIGQKFGEFFGGVRLFI